MTTDIAKDMILKELNHKNWRPSIIQSILNDCKGTRMDTDYMITVASMCADANIRDVLEGRRLRECITARAMVYKRLREKGATLMAIGRIFKKDHVTIRHSIENFNGLLEVGDLTASSAYKKFVDLLEIKEEEE